MIYFFLPQISPKGLNTLLWIKIDLLQLLMDQMNGNGKTALQMRKPLVESISVVNRVLKGLSVINITSHQLKVT